MSSPLIAPQLKGLSTQRVASLTRTGQTNIQPNRSARSYRRIIIENVFSVFNIVLFVSIGAVLYLGGSRDVFFATGLLIFNITVGLVQEIRARRALDRLSALSQTVITVRRDGKDRQISLDSIVQGDLILITPGQSIVVDGPLVYSSNLEINESSLTGESQDIPKAIGHTVTSGSYCTAGQGLMEAVKIGSQSYVYQMTQSAKVYRRHYTPVQKLLNDVLRYMIVAIAIFAPLTLISGINSQLPLASAVENMISLLTSLVPQGLIASVAILYTYGAVRISRASTLIQRINAVESLGSTTILCTDKTGTLTQNILQVNQLLPAPGIKQAYFQSSLAHFLASLDDQNSTAQALAHKLESASAWPLARQIPFKSARKWSALTITSSAKPHDYQSTYLLGAPEVLLTPSQLEEHQDFIGDAANQGQRVLAFSQSAQPLDSRKTQLPDNRQLIGLATLGDAIRPQVKQTLADFQSQGVQVKVISGDNVQTVAAIATQAGLTIQRAMSQAELEALEGLDFQQAVLSANIFGRITPEMKQKIIASLKQSTAHVAMIGDGVNDVPALKQASVSVAMNSGAQMAKDVADVVLLNDNFATLPQAIAEGRDISQRIYAIGKVFFIKAIYLMILFVLAGFAAMPFPIDLRQTTLLGFIITGIPILAVTFKLVDVAKPARPASDFIAHLLAGGIIGGLAMAYLAIISFSVLNQPLEVSKTLVTVFAALFSSLILWQVSGVTVWDFLLVRRWKQMLILSLLTIIAVGVPLVWMTDLFYLTNLGAGQTTTLFVLAATLGLLTHLIHKQLRLNLARLGI